MYEYTLLMFRFPTKESADATLQDITGIHDTIVADGAVLFRNSDGAVEYYSVNDVSSSRGATVGAIEGALIGLLGGVGGAMVGAVAGAVTGGLVAQQFDNPIPRVELDRLSKALPRDAAALVLLVEDTYRDDIIEYVVRDNTLETYTINLDSDLSYELHQRRFPDL